MLIDFINQTNDENCGAAVLAMICNRTLRRAEMVLEFKGAYPPISVREMVGALQLATMKTWVEVQTADAKLEDCEKFFIPQAPMAALIGPKKRPPYHWVAINHGKIYNPHQEITGPELLILSGVRSCYVKRLLVPFAYWRGNV
jgi:hypothetical protein